MRDFHTLPAEQKEHYAAQLNAYAKRLGGTNFLLSLIESIQESSPHPLTRNSREFSTSATKLKWNKVIFNDKLQLLTKIRKEASEEGNLLPKQASKGFKKALNLLRTMKPIVFTVVPLRREDGEGFIFQPLVRNEALDTRLNFIFEILFFTSVENAKTILNYQTRP